jgi:L-threonylcarbamoyladenylate synthase
VSRRFDCADPVERRDGIQLAAEAARRGELVVLPTDTVYGIGCDRGRDMPVPVLVGSTRALSGLTSGLTPDAELLVEAFWPGALTVVVNEAPSLVWDLGDAAGTVAVRMPLHPVAIEVLTAVGPMAVSSANRSGEPPATTCDAAEAQLGGVVGVYLDGGPTATDVPSTIVDLTRHVPFVLRLGAVSLDALREVVPEVEVEP